MSAVGTTAVIAHCQAMAYCYPGGGGGGAGLLRLTPPPTHIRKSFLREKLKFIKEARNWR